MSQDVQRAGVSGWETYAQLARELDAVRAAEAARTEGVQRGVAEMSEHADGLEGRLRAQTTALTQLGRQLRIRTGKLTPADVGPVIEPAPLLSEIAAGIDAADREATEAADRGRYPALLPRWSPGMRNLLLYGVAAAGVLIAQVIAFGRSDLFSGERPDVGSGSGPNALIVLFVLPLIGFVIANLVARVVGRPRVAEARVQTNPRMGVLLCFAIGPLAIAALLINSFTSR